MAYAYPSGDLGGSSSSLNALSSNAGHGLGHGLKRYEAGFDVLREFKHKISEDEHYISFFQDRIRVEEQYIENLTRLYDRSVAIDTLHDDAGHRKQSKTSARKAWEEVRDYTQREIQSREAMVGALRAEVVKELVKLKEEQTRIRGALKDNMKLANEMYDDHARSQLPKLKKNYNQKCQALEDHKRQEHAIAMQARLLATPSPPSPATTPLHEHPFAVPAGPSYTSPPTSTGPLPAMSNPALPQPEPVHPPFSPEKKANRLRAGSASGGESKGKDVLNDIAQQSKKGFSAFMQKLGGDKDKDKDAAREKDDYVIGGEGAQGNLQRRGTGVARTNDQKAMAAMRAVKVKRDAEEADKAYRTGVFHLESLRLRREKLHASAMNNLETFNDELSKRLRYSLESYMDTMHGTAATNAQATEVARHSIEGINLEQDMMLFRTRLRAIASPSIAPIPYENFYVGPCRSLIFGVSLTDYDFTRGDSSDHGRPPIILEKAIAAIDERGLDLEGIYRISGRHAGVQKMIQGIELDEEKFVFDAKDDVASIGNVLKQYLRELPEPVFPLPHPERVKYTESRESHIESNFSSLRARLRRLPPIHQTTFQAIIEHLGRINEKSATNKMDAKNLAVVFNSVLFGQEQTPTDTTSLLQHHQGKDTVLEDLITFSDLLFGVDSPIVAPTALPPGPALSRAGVLSYHPIDDGPQPGSSRTKIKISQPTDPSDDVKAASPIISETSSDAAPTTNEPGTAKPLALPQFDDPLVATEPFTPDDQLDLLFDAKHIPTGLRESLPDNVHIRPLSTTDLLRSHFELLNDLRESPALAPSVYTSIFQHFKSCPGTYYILVIVNKDTDRLVASGSLIIERKHINSGGLAGHIEDIVVSDSMQGKGLGQKLVVGLRDMAVGLGCYKVILDCKEAKMPFYEKCGFHKRSVGMAYYVADHQPASSLINPSSSATDSISPTVETASSPLDAASQTAPRLLTDVPPGSPSLTSASSGTGVTYSYPTANLPAWASEGLGSSPLGPPSITPLPASNPTSTETSPVDRTDLVKTPLPPGAAPASTEAEPERLS
ncbi:uncharacterized protein I303_106722 [Kwoniella dejecticola CBS 10117]|uniref:glucosamine-phosphate N-acetyltransferase n=1 Tax=Kwoniella dejecticola CBS 10117 TaxID=1296121 RepID=A0A1A5ZTV9_9TREE|nr:uncharacterized protein I303_08636 [Kwoniella dejecticola CBS 10117]OBR81251.1 hypothetical protein I303_08636 [Kwoniella dejecticola CBS 10117]